MDGGGFVPIYDVSDTSAALAVAEPNKPGGFRLVFNYRERNKQIKLNKLKKQINLNKLNKQIKLQKHIKQITLNKINKLIELNKETR